MSDLKTRDNGIRDVGKSMAGFICRMFQRTVVEPRKLKIEIKDIAEDGTKVKVKLQCGAVGWLPIDIIYNEPVIDK